MTPNVIVNPSLTAKQTIRHGFFTRVGGVSTGLYAALNCGAGSHDESAKVTENRRLALAQLGPGANCLVTADQVHGTNVAIIEDASTNEQLRQADALVTAASGIAIGVLTADCAPVLLVDDRAGVIGAAHAGWKGAFDNVLATTVDAMVRLGASPGGIDAVIGPCIAQDSYEVGPEFYARFNRCDPAFKAFFKAANNDNHHHFDLAGFVALRLRARGVGAVFCHDLDSYAREDLFFSYRRATHRGEADYGRALSAIMLTHGMPDD